MRTKKTTILIYTNTMATSTHQKKRSYAMIQKLFIGRGCYDGWLGNNKDDHWFD